MSPFDNIMRVRFLEIPFGTLHNSYSSYIDSHQSIKLTYSNSSITVKLLVLHSLPYCPLLPFHRDDTVVSHGKLLYNSKRAPDITKQSYYQKARQRLPVHVQQQFQTWHHLPVYRVPSDAAINKSAMFTQPHKAYGRHFTIHPEWGLHKPVVL